MKKNISLAVLLIVAMVSYAKAVTITDVQISPPQPSISDIITIESQGGFPGGTLFYDTSVFTKDDLSLQLDLYFTGGYGPDIPQMWQHDDVIGTLPAGNYDLMVQAYYRLSGTAEYSLHDEYFSFFEVVPEPASGMLLGIGLIVLGKINRDRRRFT